MEKTHLHSSMEKKKIEIKLILFERHCLRLSTVSRHLVKTVWNVVRSNCDQELLLSHASSSNSSTITNTNARWPVTQSATTKWNAQFTRLEMYEYYCHRKLRKSEKWRFKEEREKIWNICLGVGWPIDCLFRVLIFFFSFLFQLNVRMSGMIIAYNREKMIVF